MRSAGDVGVREDRQQLRGSTADHAGGIDVADGAGEGGGHCLESFVDSTRLGDLDEQDAKVALIAVRTGQLVLEHGSDEALVEEPRGAVDDM
ncbi:MAG: hypothetical protein AUI15_34580 [Actinobacteria bacterium 13_2_20CM_2_66_6]|nr:MAG: hypothetical protein AUI15_34580 [Actinobacteria bacterium 13_2_20CM_2_66_6]